MAKTKKTVSLIAASSTLCAGIKRKLHVTLKKKKVEKIWRKQQPWHCRTVSHVGKHLESECRRRQWVRNIIGFYIRKVPVLLHQVYLCILFFYNKQLHKSQRKASVWAKCKVTHNLYNDVSPLWSTLTHGVKHAHAHSRWESFTLAREARSTVSPSSGCNWDTGIAICTSINRLARATPRRLSAVATVQLPIGKFRDETRPNKIPNIHLQFARNDTKSNLTRLNVENGFFFFFSETSNGWHDCLKIYKFEQSLFFVSGNDKYGFGGCR